MSSDIGDLSAALLDPDHLFTGSQVAVLIASAIRWGYESRVDEENARWPADPWLLVAGELMEREVAR